MFDRLFDAKISASVHCKSGGISCSHINVHGLCAPSMEGTKSKLFVPFSRPSAPSQRKPWADCSLISRQTGRFKKASSMLRHVLRHMLRLFEGAIGNMLEGLGFKL